jgi:hypothetical protein
MLSNSTPTLSKSLFCTNMSSILRVTWAMLSTLFLCRQSCFGGPVTLLIVTASGVRSTYVYSAIRQRAQNRRCTHRPRFGRITGYPEVWRPSHNRRWAKPGRKGGKVPCCRRHIQDPLGSEENALSFEAVLRLTEVARLVRGCRRTWSNCKRPPGRCIGNSVPVEERFEGKTIWVG